jgi:hypothetical protein
MSSTSSTNVQKFLSERQSKLRIVICLTFETDDTRSIYSHRLPRSTSVGLATLQKLSLPTCSEAAPPARGEETVIVGQIQVSESGPSGDT